MNILHGVNYSLTPWRYTSFKLTFNFNGKNNYFSLYSILSYCTKLSTSSFNCYAIKWHYIFPNVSGMRGTSLPLKYCMVYCLSNYSLQYFNIKNIKWALMRENLPSKVCEQQRCRPACKSSQSDQRICYTLIAMYHI